MPKAEKATEASVTEELRSEAKKMEQNTKVSWPCDADTGTRKRQAVQPGLDDANAPITQLKLQALQTAARFRAVVLAIKADVNTARV